jgi:hypothetical protein
MNQNETARVRKLRMQDAMGNSISIQVPDDFTLDQLESQYRNHSPGHGTGLVFADTVGRRILGDKRSRISELFPELGDITITVLEDTVNA